MDVRYLGGALGRISTSSMRVHVDFDSFWRSARALLEGGDIYDTGARLVNLNPPVWTVLISPLGLMEAIDAYRLFVLLCVLVVLATWHGRPRSWGCGPCGRSWGPGCCCCRRP
jgi:hypothetical protein